jgi:prepilin-type N-terminal cleavage/methylation domain-containing protein
MIAIRRTPRGFTLLEMAVATAALGVALSAAMYIVVGVSSSAERVRRVGDTQDTARMALDALAGEIRMSGAGVSNGQIGIGTVNSGWVGRVPAIYSGPDITVTTKGGQKLVTNSIFIISSEPGAGVPSSDGAGMQGAVTSKSLDSVNGIQVKCTSQLGVAVDCTDGSFKENTIVSGLWGTKPGVDNALLVGDYANAVYLRPTQIAGAVSGSQPMQFREMKITNGFSTDPKAPFGFAQGASLGKARVTHWYLKEVSPGDWELMRSHPVLDDKWTGCTGVPGASPFIDETNSPDGPAGTVVGSGPVENLQMRFAVDAGSFDDPQKFVMWGLNDTQFNFKDGSQVTSGGSAMKMGVCDVLQDGNYASRQVREVRVSIVARSAAPDHATDGVKHVKRYGLASWEGVAPTGGALDEYPRRSFEARVVPRNLQGILRL